MIRGILLFGVAILGLPGCSATSVSRPESAAAERSEGAAWHSAELNTSAAGPQSLSAGDPMGIALYGQDAPVVALPMD